MIRQRVCSSVVPKVPSASWHKVPTRTAPTHVCYCTASVDTCSSLHGWLCVSSANVLRLQRNVRDYPMYVLHAVLPHGVQTLRETCNTGKYELIMDNIAGRLGPQYIMDR